MSQAEYSGALWVPAHPTNILAGRPRPVKGVCLHITDGHANPLGTAQMWQAPHHGSSANLVVGQLGDVIQAVSVNDRTWHAHTAGLDFIGIEHSARTPKEWGPTDVGMPVTPVQLASSAKVTAWVLKRFGLTPSRATIVGHFECDPKTDHADCPTGGGIVLDDYVQLVMAAM